MAIRWTIPLVVQMQTSIGMLIALVLLPHFLLSAEPAKEMRIVFHDSGLVSASTPEGGTIALSNASSPKDWDELVSKDAIISLRQVAEAVKEVYLDISPSCDLSFADGAKIIQEVSSAITSSSSRQLTLRIDSKTIRIIPWSHHLQQKAVIEEYLLPSSLLIWKPLQPSELESLSRDKAAVMVSIKCVRVVNSADVLRLVPFSTTMLSTVARSVASADSATVELATPVWMESAIQINAKGNEAFSVRSAMEAMSSRLHPATSAPPSPK